MVFHNSQVKTSGTFKIIVCILLGAFIPIWFVYFESIPDLIRQYRTQSFSKTEGRILSAKTILQNTSKGESDCRPAFSYQYEVNGKAYTGMRYRFFEYSLDLKSANSMVASHPAGSAIEVYYDPGNPADAVLSPRLDVQDAAHMLLGLPFLYVALFFLLKYGRQIVGSEQGEPVAGGVKIIAEKTTIHVRLPNFQPGPLGLSVTCVLSIIAGFVIPFTFASTPVLAGIFAFIITIGAGALVYFQHYRKIASGIQDLVIDENSRTLELPLTFKRRNRRALAFSDIKAVALGQERWGNAPVYSPTLLLRDGSSETLTTLGRDRAEAFVAWLWEKVGKPMPTEDIVSDTQNDS